tara:strand:- start:366 stop:569 length:204 start_codon:yes stop_codon:yes gene_type:complete
MSNEFTNLLNAVKENESLLRFYSSKKCKDCLGRGVVELTHPGRSPENFICNCIYKSIKKELSQNKTT